MRHRALKYRWRNVLSKSAVGRRMTTRQIERPAKWARLCAEQPHYLSELDYLVSIDALHDKFGYRK